MSRSSSPSWDRLLLWTGFRSVGQLARVTRPVESDIEGSRPWIKVGFTRYALVTFPDTPICSWGRVEPKLTLTDQPEDWNLTIGLLSV